MKHLGVLVLSDRKMRLYVLSIEVDEDVFLRSLTLQTLTRRTLWATKNCSVNCLKLW